MPSGKRLRKTVDGVKYDLSDDQYCWLLVLKLGSLSRGDEGVTPVERMRLKGLVRQGLAEETRQGWRVTKEGRKLLKAIS